MARDLRDGGGVQKSRRLRIDSPHDAALVRCNRPARGTGARKGYLDACGGKSGESNVTGAYCVGGERRGIPVRSPAVPEMQR